MDDDSMNFPVDFTAELFGAVTALASALERRVDAHGAVNGDAAMLAHANELICRVRDCG